MVCNHHTSEKIACDCVETYNAIVAGKDIPGFEGYCAIVREASKHADLLQAYASDLITWDREYLANYDGPFLWVLRVNGTHIVKPNEPGWEASKRRGDGAVYALKNAFTWEKQLWFWWNGKALKSVSTDEAAELLSEAERVAS